MTLRSLKIRLEAAFFKASSSKFVLSRTACLGNDLLESICRSGDENLRRINFQKNRVDHILDWTSHSPIEVKNCIMTEDIRHMVNFQNFNFLKLTHADYIVIDTYSELTDQKFRFRSSVFFCNYGDISKKMAKHIVCDGLLPTDRVLTLYREFIRRIHEKNPSCNIIFIEFPFCLDPRPKFRKRGLEIRQALDELSRTTRITVIAANDSDVEQHKNDKFYYHFSESTHRVFRQQLLKALT